MTLTIEQRLAKLERENKGLREEVDLVWTYIRSTDAARAILKGREPESAETTPP